VRISWYPVIEVLKTTSPTFSPVAPIDVPRKTDPSCRTRTAGLVNAASATVGGADGAARASAIDSEARFTAALASKRRDRSGRLDPIEIELRYGPQAISPTDTRVVLSRERRALAKRLGC